MDPYINFNHLYYFMVIAQEGSISKACKKLLLNQSTLSIQLKQLEEHIGYELFERKKKRLYLTPHGDMVLEYAAQIFRLKDEMLLSLKKDEIKHAAMQQISLGIVHSLSKTHVYEFMKQLWKKNHVQVNVHENNPSILKKQLMAGKLDVILSDSQLLGSKTGLLSHKILEREIVAVASPKFKINKNRFPQSLHGLPFLHVAEKSQFRHQLETYLYSEGVEPYIIGELEDFTLMRLAAEAGKCFIIVPKTAVKESLQEKKLVIIGRPKFLSSSMWAITRRNINSTHIIQQTISFFQRYSRTHGKTSTVKNH